MALAFNKSVGQAQKSNYFKYQNGMNKFRLIGDILPRYIYWVKSAEGNNVAVECLSFDRDKEKFTNVEKDWVAHYFPDLNCSWSYLVQCIDLTDGKVKTLPLKKKYYQAIVAAAKRLGDPTATDDTGWDIALERVSTGSQAYNVEYNLQVLDCVNRALTEDELAEVAENLQDMDLLDPRPTSDEQKVQIEETVLGQKTTEKVPDDVKKAFENEFDEDVA